jgi:hypothetical protein
VATLPVSGIVSVVWVHAMGSYLHAFFILLLALIEGKFFEIVMLEAILSQLLKLRRNATNWLGSTLWILR